MPIQRQIKSITKKYTYLTLKSKQFLLKQKNQQNASQKPHLKHEPQKIKDNTSNNKFTLKIKKYNLKFSDRKSFSQNKLKNRRNSILSSIYRPTFQNRLQNQVNTFLEEKNMNLIKENIKKLQIQLPSSMPTLLNLSFSKNFNKSFMNHLSRLECKTQRTQRKEINKEDMFIFKNDSLQETGLCFKRIQSRHFDRAKYFNCQQYLHRQSLKNNFIHRQRTEYKNHPNSSQQSLIKQRKKANYFKQDVVPIIKTKIPKPKTAGGFLKKYQIHQISIRPDFQIHISEDQVF